MSSQKSNTTLNIIIGLLIIVIIGAAYLSYNKGKQEGQRIGFEEGHEKGVEDFKEAMNIAISGSEEIFVSKDLSSQVPIEYIINNIEITTEEQMYKSIDSLNIGLIRSISTFANLTETEKDSFFIAYKSIKNQVISEYYDDYKDFLYDRTLLVNEEKVQTNTKLFVKPMSRAVCTLINLLSPFGKRKLIMSAFFKGTARKGITQNSKSRITRAAENYIEKSICRILFEGAIESLSFAMTDYASIKSYSEKLKTTERYRKMVTKLISEEGFYEITVSQMIKVKKAFRFTTDDIMIDAHYKAVVGVGVDIEKLFEAEIVKEKNNYKIVITLAEPEIISITPQFVEMIKPPNLGGQLMVKNEHLARYEELAKREAENAALNSSIMDDAKKSAAIGVKRLYDPIFFSTGVNWDLDVVFKNSPRILN